MPDSGEQQPCCANMPLLCLWVSCVQDDMPHPLMCLVEIPYSSALPSTHTAGEHP